MSRQSNVYPGQECGTNNEKASNWGGWFPRQLDALDDFIPVKEGWK